VKQFLKIVGVSILALGFVMVPMNSRASAATTYVVDPNFESCLDDLYVQRKPYTKHDCVGRIQRFLNEYKFFMGASGKANKVPREWTTLKIDSKYGPLTRRAVTEYQRLKQQDEDRSANSGPVDGKVGPLTWASIKRDCVDAWAARRFYSKACYKPVHQRSNQATVR